MGDERPIVIEERLKLQKDGERGLCLKAIAPIEAGVLVAIYDGEVLPEGDAYSIQLRENEHVCARGDTVYVNHSCKPNCICVVKEATVELYTKVPVQVGEAITFNYNTTEKELARQFECGCGHCDGSPIRGYALLTPKEKEALKDWVHSPFLLGLEDK